MMKNLRQQIGREEFDYPALMTALSGYANPRDRVTTLLRRGDIIRVKKGLYVFGDQLRRRPYSRELLANLVYGPSLVSLDSALSFHGLIPERVEAMTSVTTKRPKAFDTPVGSFIYRRAPKGYFHLGMDRVEEGDVAFLIAVPERALADKVRDDRGHPLRTQAEAARYLFDDLRIDREEFEQMAPDFLGKLAEAARSKKIALCASLLRKLKDGP
jgi:predicted transcriptional regulator of viral defense system